MHLDDAPRKGKAQTCALVISIESAAQTMKGPRDDSDILCAHANA